MKPEELQPSPDEWFKRIHADDFARVSADIDAHLSGDNPHFESEYRNPSRRRRFGAGWSAAACGAPGRRSGLAHWSRR